MSESADVPLDDLDLEILDRLARVHAGLDPPPADLDDRVVFAIDLDDVDLEVARLVEEGLVGARADERTRTTTFESASRSVAITVVEAPDGTVRVDGWLAPAVALRVELRSPAMTMAVTADAAGRFVFDGVAHGLYQLSVHSADAPRVVTPAILL
jgi:hypothetical protein